MVFQCLSCFSFPLHQLDLIWVFGAGWSSWLYQFLPFDHSGLPAVFLVARVVLPALFAAHSRFLV